MDDTEFLLIRHAESTLNASGRWQGLTDAPLTEGGRRQATVLAGELAGERVTALYASDLRRARETAAVIGTALGLEPRCAPLLRELDVGDWGGLRREEIARRWPEQLARFDSGDPDARAVGGESRRELERRVRRALARIAAAHPGERVGVVTHLGPILALVPDARPANASWCRVTARALSLVPAVRAGA